jgi:hypothetical protein
MAIMPQLGYAVMTSRYALQATARVGLEPTTPGLTVQNSTIELPCIAEVGIDLLTPSFPSGGNHIRPALPLSFSTWRWLESNQRPRPVANWLVEPCHPR